MTYYIATALIKFCLYYITEAVQMLVRLLTEEDNTRPEGDGQGRGDGRRPPQGSNERDGESRPATQEGENRDGNGERRRPQPEGKEHILIFEHQLLGTSSTGTAK